MLSASAGGGGGRPGGGVQLLSATGGGVDVPLRLVFACLFADVHAAMATRLPRWAGPAAEAWLREGRIHFVVTVPAM